MILHNEKRYPRPGLTLRNHRLDCVLESTCRFLRQNERNRKQNTKHKPPAERKKMTNMTYLKDVSINWDQCDLLWMLNQMLKKYFGIPKLITCSDILISEHFGISKPTRFLSDLCGLVGMVCWTFSKILMMFREDIGGRNEFQQWCARCCNNIQLSNILLKCIQQISLFKLIANVFSRSSPQTNKHKTQQTNWLNPNYVQLVKSFFPFIQWFIEIAICIPIAALNGDFND